MGESVSGRREMPAASRGFKDGAGRNTPPPGLFEAIFESTTAAQFVCLDGQILYSNPAFRSVTGYSADELSLIPVGDLFSPAIDIREGEDRLKPMGDGVGRELRFETRVARKDGKDQWISLAIAPLQTMPGPAWLGTAYDIGEFKMREDVLKRSEMKYRTVFDMAPDMMVIYNTDGLVTDMNVAAERADGVSREQIVNKLRVMDSGWSQEDMARFAEIRRKTLEDGEWQGEVRAILPGTAQVLDIDSHVKVADLDSEQVVICISRDITARKKMEEQIRDALREKEVLLREIHHRVKNNMQIISSLLKLQSQTANDPKTMGLFRESQNRILSMAMIHEKLYQSEGLHRVNLRDYIEDLVHEVSASFGDVAGRIGLKVAVDDLAATMDMCIPCGLIIIELISNALKYAFPDGHHGEVSVNLHHNGNGDVRLTVSDNGVGIPEGLDLVGLKSLGLRLVSDLVRYQLRGDLEFISDKGTTVHVAFKEAPTPTDTNSPE